MDLDRAYYQIFIMREFSHLFGIHWQGKVVFPLFMPFGKATIKISQSITGKLRYAANAVHGSHAFV